MRYFSGKRLVAFTLSLVLFAAVFVCDIPSSRAEEPPAESPAAAPTETAAPEPTETSTQTPAQSEEPIETPMPTEQPTTVPLPSEEPSPTPIPLPTDDMLPELPEIELPGDLEQSQSALGPTVTSGDYDYADNGDGTVTITGYHGAGGDITIPSTLDGKAVTAIGGFNENNEITSVRIQEGIISILSGAFEYCQRMERVYLPSSLITIGDYAFNTCYHLLKIDIPSNVNSIGKYALSRCYYLEEINVDPGNASYCSQDGVLFNITKTVLMQYPPNNPRQHYDVPNSVLTIDGFSFIFCRNLKRLYIPNGVQTIGELAFLESVLEYISIPASITDIGKNAFLSCYNLKSINVSKENSFYMSLDGVLFNKAQTVLLMYPTSDGRLSYSIPDGTQTISDDVKFGFELENITIPSSVSTINSYVFRTCNKIKEINVDSHNTNYSSQDGVLFNKLMTCLIYYPSYNLRTSYIIPNSVEKISWNAFYNARFLKDVSIPSSVKEIEGYAFSCSAIRNILIPNSISEIESYTFEGCSNLQVVILSDGISRISVGAFEGCNGLHNIVIPQSVTYIGSDAFRDCRELDRIYFFGNAPDLDTEAIINCKAGLIIKHTSTATGFTNPWNGYPTLVFDPEATYKLDFDTQGGSNIPSISGKFNMIISEPAQPVKDGYVFDGWYSTSGCNDKKIEFPYAVCENTLLYAKWIPIYTVTFNSGTQTTCIRVPYLTSIDVPKSPEKTGYFFIGWCETPSCDTPTITFPYVVTADATLYAKWIPYMFNCIFVWDIYTGSQTMSLAYGTVISEAPKPRNGNKSFAGWYPTWSCDTAPISFPYTVTHDMIFYAKWQYPGPYISNLILNGGNLSGSYDYLVKKYTITLGENESSVKITPDICSGAIMTINGKAVSSTTVTLANGKSKTVTIKVKYGKKTNTYKFTVTRAKSSDNNLAALSNTAGTWSQPFDPNVTNYTVSLDHDTKSVMIKALKANAMAKISPASKKLTLKNGQTKVIKFTVKAQSGAKKVYTVTVTRAP